MKLVFEGQHGNEKVYMDTLNAILGDTPRNSMIDLGCHHAAHTPLLKFKNRKYIDILPNQLDFVEEQQYFEQGDILNTPLDKHYDVAFALDVIEHLTIDNGYKFIKIMEAISDKQILFTPLGEMWVGNSGHPEEHSSGWTPEMLQGYASIVFPHYHKIWGFGAFFFWKCENIEADFKRVSDELIKKSQKG